MKKNIITLFLLFIIFSLFSNCIIFKTDNNLSYEKLINLIKDDKIISNRESTLIIYESGLIEGRYLKSDSTIQPFKIKIDKNKININYRIKASKHEL